MVAWPSGTGQMGTRHIKGHFDLAVDAGWGFLVCFGLRLGCVGFFFSQMRELFGKC